MSTALALDAARVEELVALQRVALLVARDAPQAEVFAAAAEQAAALLGVESAAVLRLAGSQRAVVVGTWQRPDVRGLPVNAELDFDAGTSALGRVLATRRPARTDGYQGEGELALLMRAIGRRSALAAPVLVNDEVWGALAVASTHERPPPPAGSEERLVALAELVAQAVVNAQARRRLVGAADEARRRLERALHEGPQQQLLALGLKLRLACAEAPAGSRLARLLEDALGDAMAAAGALGELGRGLHPLVLSERGLAAAVQALAARSRVAVHLRELPARRFAPGLETTAYAVVAEALDGIRAGAADVIVADRGHRLLVEVAGEGAGAADLHGLAERVAASGGRLKVDATVVRAELPLTG